MLMSRKLHLIILIGILGLILPMGFDLGVSSVVSIGFASVFSLLRVNAKLVKNYKYS